MTLRTRIFLVYLLLIGGGYAYLFTSILGAIRPRYLESMEATLIDTAAYLAAVAETQVSPDGEIALAPLRQAFDAAAHRPLNAQVYSFHKNAVDLRVYLTDANGLVRYDSDGGRDEGRDFSNWNDVARTLQGRYGARATRLDPEREDSLVIHVAAPVHHGERIVGVLSVGKPTANINALVAHVRTRVLAAGLIGGGLVLATGLAFSIWILTPLEKLTAYARAVRDGRPAALPTRLAGREVGELRLAFEEMRAALEGKAYVERYTQTLAHEIKAPLAAIRGAAELLAEDAAMPAPQRARFLQNLRSESGRIQTLVDKLLELAALENRRTPAASAPVELRALLQEALAAAEPIARARSITLTLDAPAPVTILGERFLLAQAVSNLLQNALEFTPPAGCVTVGLHGPGSAGPAGTSPTPKAADAARVRLTVDDTGPGIPDYALPRLFERFYSLPRPDTGAKSTGLGLSFVREIAQLHSGDIRLENRPAGGTRATLSLAAE